MSEERLDYSGHQTYIKVASGSATEDVHYSIFCKDLPKVLTENALRELNETEENRAKGIESLEEFIREKELRCEDEELLLWVLRNCKYNIKKSQNKLERFLKTRRMVGRRLAQVPISVVKDALNELAIGLLPYRDKHGRVIVFSRPLLQVGNYDTDFLACVFLSCMMFILSLPMSTVLGTVYIGEAKNMSIFVLYPLMKLYKSFALHVIFFHGSGYRKLQEAHHPDILPEDFGGNLEPFSDELYRKELLSFIEKLKSESDEV